VQPAPGAAHAPSVATLRMPGAWLGMTAFALDVGLEQSAGAWAYRHLTAVRSVPPARAGEPRGLASPRGTKRHRERDISRAEPSTRWDPALYARFERERAQPFFDLVARLPDGPVWSAADLGCGAGELTRTLADRWPDAAIVGVDSSEEMLAKAAALPTHPRIRFVHGDLRAWRPEAPVDRIVSNAALQWVGDHEALLARLVDCLAAGGALAVQMPDNDDEPTHRIAAALWREPRFAAQLGEARAERRVQPAAWYGERLLALGCEIDVWRTTYLHRMRDAADVVEWVKGTLLRPVISRLAGAELDAFLSAYTERVRDAYPAGPHGVWFPFPRLFLVARRVA